MGRRHYGGRRPRVKTLEGRRRPLRRRRGRRGRLPPQQARGVLEVDLAQDRLGQAHAVDLPAALDGRGVLELPVAGLEVAPGGAEEALLVGARWAGRRRSSRTSCPPGVPPMPVSVPNRTRSWYFSKKRAHLVGVVAADLGHAGGGVDVEVRVLVQHARHQVGILGRVAEVHADEGGLGVPGHPPLERRVQLLPRRQTRPRRGTTSPGAPSARRSARCLASAGFQNALGSPVWMATGMPSSPAFSNSGSRPGIVDRQRPLAVGRRDSRGPAPWGSSARRRPVCLASASCSARYWP